MSIETLDNLLRVQSRRLSQCRRSGNWRGASEATKEIARLQDLYTKNNKPQGEEGEG